LRKRKLASSPGPYIEKYKLDHIYAEKDGDPVEIFPVWEDDYLPGVP
jgi:hypothetical protein